MNANGELGFKEKQNYFHSMLTRIFFPKIKNIYFYNANADNKIVKEKNQPHVIFPYFYRMLSL